MANVFILVSVTTVSTHLGLQDVHLAVQAAMLLLHLLQLRLLAPQLVLQTQHLLKDKRHK